MMNRPTVGMVRCPGYNVGRRRQAVEEALFSIPAAREVLISGAKVLLKPNLLSPWDPPERAVNTHPAFVKAVAELCISLGCTVRIGDSCGSLGDGTTSRAMSVTGLPEVAEQTGAELVDFDRYPAVAVRCPDAEVLREPFKVSAAYCEADVVVTLPKFKTHGLTLLTGAVKNQFGMIPGRGKKEVHLKAPRPEKMARALVDVYSTVRPHLAVMDGILAMEGAGPTAGDPRELGLVLASDDGVALDAAQAAVIGVAEGAVLTTRYADERGVGIGRLSHIDVVGVPLTDVVVADFRKPATGAQNALMNLVPESAVRWLFSQFGGTHPRVDHGKCVLCGECVKNCPASALSRADGRVQVDASRCIACYCCTEVCPHRAITMVQSPLHRILAAVRRDGRA